MSFLPYAPLQGNPRVTPPLPCTEDLFFPDVTLLLHMEGVDGGTTFIDSSSYARTPSAVAGCTISSEQAKFGPTSGRFRTTNNELSYAASADFDFPGDFTLEAFVYPVETGGTARVIATRRVFNNTGVGTWRWATTAFQELVTGANIVNYTLTTGEWNHLAITREGTTVRAFVNGALVSTAASSIDFTNTSQLLFGKDSDIGGAGQPVGAYLAEVRVTKGVARYAPRVVAAASQITYINKVEVFTSESFITVPAHAAGDLLVLFVRAGSTNTIPATTAGFTSVASATGSFEPGWRISFLHDLENSVTSVPKVASTLVTLLIFRGAYAVGNTAVTSGVGPVTSINLPALSLQNTAGNSVALTGASYNQGVALLSAPSGLTSLSVIAVGGSRFDVWRVDPSGGASFAGGTVAVDQGFYGSSWSIELLAGEIQFNFTPPALTFCDFSEGVPVIPAPIPTPTPLPISPTAPYKYRLFPGSLRRGDAVIPAGGLVAFVFQADGTQPGAALLSATLSASNAPPGVSFAIQSYATPYNSNVAIIATGTPSTNGVFDVTVNTFLSGVLVASGVWPVTVYSAPRFTLTSSVREVILSRGQPADVLLSTFSVDIPATVTIIGEPSWFSPAGLSLDLIYTSGTPGSGSVRVTGMPVILVNYPLLISIVYSVDGDAVQSSFHFVRVV